MYTASWWLCVMRQEKSYLSKWFNLSRATQVKQGSHQSWPHKQVTFQNWSEAEQQNNGLHQTVNKVIDLNQ